MSRYTENSQQFQRNFQRVYKCYKTLWHLTTHNLNKMSNNNNIKGGKNYGPINTSTNCARSQCSNRHHETKNTVVRNERCQSVVLRDTE